MQSPKQERFLSCSNLQEPICHERTGRFAWFLLALAFLSGLLSGQTVTFSGPAVNFGKVNVCAPGKTAPTPCSQTQMLTYKVTAGGILGTPKVLTLGAPNLDFTLAGTTCSGSVATGSSCTVMASLSPRFPGLRAGAVQITDVAGNLLATTFVYGVGLAPQVVIAGAAPIQFFNHPDGNGSWGQPAVDAAGNVFVPNGQRSYDGGAVYEIPAGGGPVRTLGSGLDVPAGVAVDGAGNLFVTEFERDTVVEIPAGCNNVSCQINLDGGFRLPYGIAADGAGNVYVAGGGVVEMPAGCINLLCARSIGLFNAEAIAVGGPGDLYVADFRNSIVVKVPLAGGPETVVAHDLPLTYGLTVDAAGDLLITDPEHGRILEQPAAGGALSTFSSNLVQPNGMALDAAGNVFYTGGNSDIAVSEIKRSPVSAYSFATTAPGTVSTDSPQVYTVENSGNTVLSLNALAVGTDANFTQVDAPGGLENCAGNRSLVPGEECAFSISFTPTVAGPLTGAAVLTDNALNLPGATQTIPLSGMGGVTGPINFAHGFPAAPPGLELNGGAAVAGNLLELTDGGTYESRSVFARARVGLASFQTSFDFQLTGSTPEPDADGFAFVLQANGPNAVGSAGGGLGYGLPSPGQTGPAITNSVAIKFDLHDNDGEGSSSTGLYIDGQAPTTPSITLLPEIDLHSGHIFQVVLVYDGSILSLTLTDLSNQATFRHSFAVDIAGTLGGPTGYAGFTAGTGAKTAVENILNWQLTSTECCTAGEPSFPTGFTAPDLVLNGDAKFFDGALQLTQDTALETSSAFSSMAVPVTGFTSDFDFKMSPGFGDGFAFVLQAEGLNALGSGGGGLGYGPGMPGGAGAKIAHSVAVKFDLHSDAGEGSNSTGVYVDGASPTVPCTELTGGGINLHRGHAFHVRVSYATGLLTLRITDLTEYAVFAGTYPVDVGSAVGKATAYAGFTASTGVLFNTVKILNWSMSSY